MMKRTFQMNMYPLPDFETDPSSASQVSLSAVMSMLYLASSWLLELIFSQASTHCLCQ